MFEPHLTSAATAVQFMMENAGLDYSDQNTRVQFMESIFKDFHLQREYSRLSAMGLLVGRAMEAEYV